MPPKRKANAHSAGGAAESQTTTDNGTPHGKRLRADQLFDDASSESLASHEPKPFLNIKHAQTKQQPRPSALSLNIATQGQDVNPVAPSYCSDEEEASQITPSPKPLTQVQPFFMVSQSGQQFRFKLPSQSSTAQYIGCSAQAGMISVPRDHAALARCTPSFKGYQSSLPSSHGSSVFSAALSCGGSTAPTSAPTSRAPSECRSNGDYGTQCDDANTYQLAPLRQSSQLQALAAHFQNRLPLPSLNINTQVMNPLIHPHHDLLGCVEPNVDCDGSPAVDEASLSDDDRFAESVLCGQGFPSENPDAHTSMLANLRWNVLSLSQPSPHMFLVSQPLKEMLKTLSLSIASQNSQSSCSASHTNSAVDDLDNLETPISTLVQSSAQQSSSATDINLPSVAHPVATIVSNTSSTLPDNNDPLQLQFYVPSVCDIIERAKQFSHCDIASVNSLPLHPDFNNKAIEYMNEAITSPSVVAEVYQFRMDGGPNMSDITRLLWEDIGNWWSSLKKKARSYVHERYEWDPENCCTVNADIVKKLLDRGFFLKHGVDKEDHTNTLAHPALSGLIIYFFYTGPNLMGNLFPEVFKKEVPRATIALAATAIKLVLDEMAAEGKEVTFKRDVYSDVYVNIISLMTKCDTVPVHRAKTKALCVQGVKIER
ncbi:hypothetical protein BS17DRAFT_813129 [Gyrodon lividus]|nr:hypothetical protein BS17DRAFT_813129 [Gyrodon lividus]